MKEPRGAVFPARSKQASSCRATKRKGSSSRALVPYPETSAAPQPLHCGLGGAQVALDASGKLLAVGGEDGHVHVWRLEPFALLLTAMPTPPGNPRRRPDGDVVVHMGAPCPSALAFSPDASALATGAGAMVIFWDLSTGARRDSLWLARARPWSNVERLAFSRQDGSLLAGTQDGQLYSIDVREMRVRWVVDPGAGQPYVFSISPDGALLRLHGRGGWFHRAHSRDLQRERAVASR